MSGGTMSDPCSAVIERTDPAKRRVAAEVRSAVRRILCVFPRYEPSLGSFEYAYDITGGLRAFMPPQGLLVIAASTPP